MQTRRDDIVHTGAKGSFCTNINLFHLFMVIVGRLIRVSSTQSTIAARL